MREGKEMVKYEVKVKTDGTDSRMPCGITDDPYNDYSDYIEEKGVYSQPTEDNDGLISPLLWY
jgi:hypothetical protein